MIDVPSAVLAWTNEISLGHAELELPQLHLSGSPHQQMDLTCSRGGVWAVDWESAAYGSKWMRSGSEEGEQGKGKNVPRNTSSEGQVKDDGSIYKGNHLGRVVRGWEIKARPGEVSWKLAPEGAPKREWQCQRLPSEEWDWVLGAGSPEWWGEKPDGNELRMGSEMRCRL